MRRRSRLEALLAHARVRAALNGAERELIGKVAAIDLGLEPIRVALVAGGKAFVGGVASLDAAAKANAKLNGKLDVGANLDVGESLDAKAKLAADAKAKLDQSAKAAASLKVTAPKVDLNAKKSASASAKAGGGKAAAKASAGFSFGAKYPFARDVTTVAGASGPILAECGFRERCGLSLGVA